jgi:formamidopyrimidine-DNA glycosylase
MRLYRGKELGGLLDGIGVEPLSEQFTPAWLLAAASRTRKPAKIFLMDQQHIAGLGNIYAAEALFRAGIDPRKPAASIRKAKIEALHQAIVDVLTEGVQSAVKAYSRPGVFNEAEEFPCDVYDREGEPCNRCGRKIQRIPQGGRSTYFCARCQR